LMKSRIALKFKVQCERKMQSEKDREELEKQKADNARTKKLLDKQKRKQQATSLEQREYHKGLVARKLKSEEEISNLEDDARRHRADKDARDKAIKEEENKKHEESERLRNERAEFEKVKEQYTRQITDLDDQVATLRDENDQLKKLQEDERMERIDGIGRQDSIDSLNPSPETSWVIGDRIETREGCMHEDVDDFSYTPVAGGLKGTITEMIDDNVIIKMDDGEVIVVDDKYWQYLKKIGFAGIKPGDDLRDRDDEKMSTWNVEITGISETTTREKVNEDGSRS